MVTFIIRLLKSAVLARKIVNNFQPQLAIGVGGYASGPLLRAAAAKNIPTLIQEQNSYAGITNKMLGKKVKTICVAYENMERFFPASKIVLTGNPVRENLIHELPERGDALEFFGLKPGRRVVLIVGGSLGARSINNAVLKNLEFIRQSDVEFIWQTGVIYFDRICSELEGNQPANLHITSLYRVWIWPTQLPGWYFARRRRYHFRIVPDWKTFGFGAFAQCGRRSPTKNASHWLKKELLFSFATVKSMKIFFLLFCN
jgi:hypothetical protein